MKIYTKTGDGGETGLLGEDRVPKDHNRIRAYGTVDELNAALGVARTFQPGPTLARTLGELQQHLFVLGADLASPRPTSSDKIPRISGAHVALLEQSIDRLDANLKPLKEFVLPGGSPLAAQLHVARTVCRRAEREVVELSRTEDLGSDVIPFLNRLSDLLFMMARTANRDAHVEEITWSGREG